jgi:hypothetical protein
VNAGSAKTSVTAVKRSVSSALTAPLSTSRDSDSRASAVKTSPGCIGGCLMSEPVPVLGSTPTPELRCQMALNMLNQRPWDLRLCQMLEAVMRGVTLAELIDFELQA